jgi:hypothetical protein
MRHLRIDERLLVINQGGPKGPPFLFLPRE